MKYWLYSEGNILGPYAPVELLSLPAFSQGSLVCQETSAGDNPADWKAAEGVAEIASALSVCVGGVISSQAGGISGPYEEAGSSFTVGASYYEAKNDQQYGYENILNTIENILGADKEPEAPADAGPAADYELMDRFDIRLSRIQEELEAARWEKNLLLEKIRSKETEERKSRELIAELEEKLKGALDQTRLQENKLSQARRFEEPTVRPETLKKADGPGKEDLADNSPAPSSPAAQPAVESVIFKRIQPSGGISPERAFIKEKEGTDNNPIASGKLKSLGRGPAPVIPVSGEEHKGGAPGSESFSAPADAASAKDFQPPPLRASGIASDFSVTGPAVESGKDQKTEPKDEPEQNLWVSKESIVLDNLETFKKTDGPGKEDLADNSPAPSSPAAQPAVESIMFKRIQPSSGISPERAFIGEKEGTDNSAIASGKLKSLGRSSAPVIPVSGEEHKGGAPGSESFSAPADAASAKDFQPPPRRASGIASDFSVTGPVVESGKDQIKTEPKNKPEPQSRPPATQPVPKPSVPQSQFHNFYPPQPVYQPQPASDVQLLNAWQSQQEPAEPQNTPQVPFREPVAPDKSGRVIISARNQIENINMNIRPVRKGRGKMAFISTLIIFGVITAGVLGYFFLGDDAGFSKFSSLNPGGPGKEKFSFSTQIEPKADTARTETAAVTDPQVSAASAKPVFETVSNENTRKALETVKNYKLSGGRGTVASWFANSFLSNTASGSNEEWSATILHGDIFVVQYRLLRPKQDPLIYQFEVDVAKNIIVRGINNNAIELLDFSSGATAKAAPAALRRAAAPRAVKSRGIPILSLPDAPAAKPVRDDTGLEAAAPGGSEKVKYIIAQESDEELF